MNPGHERPILALLAIRREQLDADLGVHALDDTDLLNGVSRNIRIYHVGNRQIWGLTARVLQNLLIRLGLESEEEN